MNIRPALGFSGRLLLILAAAELLPAVCSAVYGESTAAWAFVTAAVVTGVCGGAMAFFGREDGELYRREGILIVVSSWVLASLFGALPYILSGAIPNPIDALFESTSGFTTTGASILPEIEGAGYGVLFWRSFSQWLGGMGIIVLFVALLPELGPGARFLYKLEVPGPTAETLHPRVRDTAAVLWKIYLGLTFAQIVLLLLAGLNLYDAATHTFSTLSTGGFSPRNQSVAAYPSPLVQTIIVIFMIIAGVNFSLYYGLRRDRGAHLLRDPEFRIYVGMILALSLVMTWDLRTHGGYSGMPRAFLDSIFQVASILTTTGFATVDFDAWPQLSKILLVVIMFVGGCAGSTAGGVKIMRYVIGIKSSIREVRMIYSPSSVMSVFIGGKAVPNGVVRSVAGFFILYFIAWGLGALLLTSEDISLVSSVTASIAVLGNIGPGLEAVGPTASFAFFSGWQKVVMVVLMWLGRLEIYAIAALFTGGFWRR